MTSIFLSGNGLNILVYARNSVINSQAGRGCSCVREQSLDAKMGPIEFSDLGTMEERFEKIKYTKI